MTTRELIHDYNEEWSNKQAEQVKNQSANNVLAFNTVLRGDQYDGQINELRKTYKIYDP